MTHREQLDDLAAAGRLRGLHPRAGMDFSSNDYLGLANSPRLREAVLDALLSGVAIGSGGSRLLRGNDPEHERQALSGLRAEAPRLVEEAAHTLPTHRRHERTDELVVDHPGRLGLPVAEHRDHGIDADEEGIEVERLGDRALDDVEVIVGDRELGGGPGDGPDGVARGEGETDEVLAGLTGGTEHEDLHVANLGNA